MCIGTAVLLILPEGAEPYVVAKENCSSHDTLLHEKVPVELHNRVVKIEAILPDHLRVDAPDVECAKAYRNLGAVIDGQFGLLQLKSEYDMMVRGALPPWGVQTLQGADLLGAHLQGAYLREADLQGADLQGAYLREADLSGQDIANLKVRGAII